MCDGTYDIHPRYRGRSPRPGREARVALVRILEEMFVSGVKVIQHAATERPKIDIKNVGSEDLL